MARYYTTKAAVRIPKGYMLAYDPRHGYYAKPRPTGLPRPPRNPLAPWNPNVIDAEVKRRTDAVLGPATTEAEQARTRATQQGQAQIATSQAAAQALAALQQGIGPGIQEGYQQAAGFIGGLGAGFAGDARQALEADSAATMAALQEDARSPLPPGLEEAVKAGSAATATGDAIYQLGGRLPAEGLAREGAAFGAAGRMLPAQALGLGQQEIGQIQGRVMEALRGIDDQLAGELSKRPQIAAEIRDALMQNELQKIATRGNLRALGLKEEEFGFQQEIERGRLGVARTSAQTARMREQRLRKDAAKVEKQSGQTVNVSLSKAMGYYVNDQGQPILRNGKRVPLPKEARDGSKNTAKSKSIGARNDAIRDAVQDVPHLVKDNFMDPYVPDQFRPEFLDKRGKVKYSMVKARIISIIWPQVSGYSTGAGRKSLRAALGRQVDSILRGMGIAPSPAVAAPRSGR